LSARAASEIEGRKEGYLMIGGFVVSLVVVAIGAVLDFALTTSPDQHGFDVQTVGLILLVVGAIGAVVSLVAVFVAGTGRRQRRTVIDDGRGNVVRREDSYL
jgi:hypothetical protein